MITINGVQASDVVVSVPQVGVWVVDLSTPIGDEDLAVGVAVKIAIDDVELTGTISESSTDGGSRQIRVKAGAGGWSKDVARKGYHNDAGVKAKTVIQDLARLAGETLADTVAPNPERLPSDFWRPAAPASFALEAAAGDASWWVDYDGVTQIGNRPEHTPTVDTYRVVSVDPLSQSATLDVDTLDAVVVGSTIALESGPVVARSLEYRARESTIELVVRYGDGVDDLLSALVRRVVGYPGVYHYRVVSMSTPRVNVKAVGSAPALPNGVMVGQWSAPGVHAELLGGCDVAVAFLNGELSRPVIIGVAGQYDNNTEPTKLELGGAGGAPVARVGDIVNVALGSAPIPVSGTITGVGAFSGLMTPAQSATGVIQSGSSRVFAK